MSLDALLSEVRGCTLCQEALPLGPRPIVRIAPTARVLIIGQAPGTKVHDSGIPWNDPSGDRLRDWLQMDRETFYDESKLAIMPMGFCYPGRNPNGGDNPPRPECAPAWHDKLLRHLPDVRLTLLIGSYAQKRYLGSRGRKTMTENVRAFADYRSQGYLPLPHPSWRTNGWQRKNQWFDEEVLPYLRNKTAELIGERPSIR